MSNQPSQPLVLGLDVGTGSLGLAIRCGSEIVYSKVALFDQDFASTKAAATKRRMMRTRIAHKEREQFLNSVWEGIGQEPLKKFKRDERGELRITFVDERLKREFPNSLENTLYNSSLLRITILEGNIKSLQPWQIYKALHSSIQKRGYGQVPWATNGKGNVDDEKENQEGRNRFLQELSKMSPNPMHHFAPYLRAWKMGLWDPERGILSIRQTSDREPKPFGLISSDGRYLGLTIPRDNKEQELKRLLIETKKVFPNLDVDYALYGQVRKPLKTTKDLRSLGNRSKSFLEKSWQGLLSQKLPRFENRVLANCSIFPRLHVCSSSSLLARKFHFLSSLHRLRVVDLSTGELRGLSPNELNEIFNRVQKDKGFLKKWGLTKTQLRIHLKSINLTPQHDDQGIPEAKTTGRSRFSRPALHYLIQFYLLGKTPKQFLEWALTQPCNPNSALTVLQNTHPMKGLTEKDFRWINLVRSESWEKFYVPDGMDAFLESKQSRKDAIDEELSRLNNPVVKHRVKYVLSEVRESIRFIRAKYQRDTFDRIALEFVREDFMTPKKKTELMKAIKENEKAYKRAVFELGKAGLKDGNNLVKKFLLAERQNWTHIIPTTGDRVDSQSRFGISDLPNMEIAHIVPQSLGGPTTMWNLFLLTAEQNRDQRERTPYNWLSGDKELWNKFLQNVNLISTIPKKTKNLLLSPDANELCERIQQLPQTAWIARVLRRLLQLEFGWPIGFAEMERKLQVYSGGLTSAARRQYRLNPILGEDEKNRKNPRHHALDAMVLAFIAPRSVDKGRRERILDWEDNRDPKETFSKWIEQVYPEYVGRKKPALEENFYAKRIFGEKRYIYKRTTLRSLAYKMVINKEVFDVENLAKILSKKDLEMEFFGDAGQRFLAALETQIKLLEASPEPETLWQEWIKSYRDPKTGHRVRRLRKLDTSVPLLENGEFVFLEPPKARIAQVLKPKGTHVGQIIYMAATKRGPKAKIRPVYVHENKEKVLREFRNQKGYIAFIQSKDLIRVKENVDETIPAGIYRIDTLKTSGQLKISKPDGTNIKKELNIQNYVDAGVEVIKSTDLLKIGQ